MKDFKEFLIEYVMPLFTGFIIGASLAFNMATDFQRHLAIEAGVGRWTIDENTGDSLFVYGVKE